MKRFLIFAILALFLCAPVCAFEAVSSGGVGWIMQTHVRSEMGYYFGINAPVVEKKEVGYTLYNETGYMYSGFSDNIKALRTYAVNSKALVTRLDWGLNVALGGGVWQFLVENNETEAELLGGILARLGLRWKFMEFNLTGEAIQKQGPDIFFPSLGVNISF